MSLPVILSQTSFLRKIIVFRHAVCSGRNNLHRNNILSVVNYVGFKNLSLKKFLSVELLILGLFIVDVTIKSGRTLFVLEILMTLEIAELFFHCNMRLNSSN